MLEKVYADKLKAQLMGEIRGYSRRHKMTQADMSYLLDTSQPRISDLFLEKTDRFSVDQLLKWAYILGISFTLTRNQGEKS